MQDLTNNIKSILFGIATGDALGVPVEFHGRETLIKNPVTDMTGYRSHFQPPGTWSDDSSLAFCLAEVLAEGFNLNRVSENFVKWLSEAYWTPHGRVFDIGFTTKRAIENLKNRVAPELAGVGDANSNSNGSLMRILPLLFYIRDKPIEERFKLTRQVSSLTHSHIRSVIACFYYLEFALQLLKGRDIFTIYDNLKVSLPEFLYQVPVPESEINKLNRLLKHNIYKMPASEIQSSGYVIHTLEASIWCLLTTENFRDAVLKAVNLGEDTDTTGAVTGGLAGLLYGFDAIPKKWVNQLARANDIEDLAERLSNRLFEF